MPDGLLGLRERKKLKTRKAIQEAAMRLFLEKGFQATTVEEIAEVVEISPSTFFNYFPSKEALVLQDDLDPPLIAALDAQPLEVAPIAALRNAMRVVFSGLTPEQDAHFRQRMALLVGDDHLRAAMLSQFAGMIAEVADVMRVRVGRSSSDFRVRNLAGALVGVIMAVMVDVAEKPETDVIELLDAALSHLEHGLPLE